MSTFRLNVQNYRTLVDKIPDIVFMHQDDKIVFINKAVESLLGFNEEEIIGSSLMQFIAKEDDKRRVADAIQRRANGETVPDYEINILDKKGGEHTVVVRASRTEYDGRPAFQVILIDITKLKRAEEEILRSRKLESLGILAGGIAHDFNNILTGIVSGIAAARMIAKTGSDMYTLLQQIEKAAFKASELTQELLTFSQGGEPVLKSCRLRPIIDEAVRLATFASMVSYRVEVPDNLLCVVVDKSQIVQVFDNLFVNAILAMPSGGTITVRASNTIAGNVTNPHAADLARIDSALPLKDGVYVRVDIEDTGMGVPKDNLEKIFDPFFSTKPGGAGLGLATVYSILQHHSGHITVKSDVGKGTIFSLFLPATFKSCRNDTAGKKALARTQGKVLIMDDDETILFTLNKLLQAIGYSVECVHNGEEAFEVYRTANEKGEPFCAVLMDLTIHGGMGGKETVGKLLAFDAAAKVIAISGYSNDPVLTHFKQHGFVAALRKPFKPEELGALLKSIANAPVSENKP